MFAFQKMMVFEHFFAGEIVILLTSAMHSKDTLSPGTSQKSELLLHVKNISRKVSGNWIWENISFELPSGQRLALSGTSDSGKSMLLQRLLGQRLFLSWHSEHYSVQVTSFSLIVLGALT